MDFNIAIRKKQLDNLDQLVSSSRHRLQSVLTYLNWSPENVQNEDALVQCPVNPHHRICPKSWNEHIEKCVVKVEGYNLIDQFLSDTVHNSAQSTYIDRNKKIEIITKELAERGTLRLAWNGLDPDPRTSDRLISTFSPDERLIFYNFCVKNTTGPPTPPEFTTIHKKSDEERPLSHEELLTQERDAKRRRAKYRSVHLNRKKYTEVIKEVIDGQMEEYREWLQNKQVKDVECNSNNNENKRDQERPHSSTSKNSNHSSSSRSTSRKYDRHGDSRGRYYNSTRNSKTDEHTYDENLSSKKKERRYSRERERRDSRERRNSVRKGEGRRSPHYKRSRNDGRERTLSG